MPRRRNQSVAWGLVRWVLVLAIIGGAGYFAYIGGEKLAREEVVVLEQQIGNLREENATLRTEMAGLEAAVRQAHADVAQWRQRYEREVPGDTEQAILDLVRQRRDEGISIGRLAFIVSEAEEEPTCVTDPVTRRFIVQTPIFGGANDSVSFADNTVTVTAQGVSARSAAGAPEAWFDPGQEVVARFTHIGGATSETRGLLPLQHAMVVDGVEYRFGLVAGDRSFVSVTADACQFP